MAKYIIAKGFHISHIFPRFYRKLFCLRFDFVFTSNCIYDLGTMHNLDVNKLYGISFGFIHNTTTLWGRLFKSRANSFRIGWNCSRQNRKIQLYAYYYNKGKREIKYITDIDLNRNYKACVFLDRPNSKIDVLIESESNNTNPNFLYFSSSSSYYFDFTKTHNYGLKLMPYFGGTIAALHKMIVYITSHE